MTTPSTSRKAGPLLGTGSQTTWPFTFKVFAATDIAVTIADSLGVETALVYNVDYSVTLNANQETSPGGTVTYPISGAALPVGKRLVIIGNLPYDQPLDLPSGGNFSPLALENQLDRLTMQIQQLRENVGRALQLPVTAAGTLSVQLPQPEPNELLGWDPTGQNLQNFAVSELATAVAYATMRYDTFTGDGTTTQFPLSADPVTLANLDIAISGVTQVPGSDYSLVSGVLVFASAPANGTQILARYGEGLVNVGGDSSDIRFLQAGSGAVDRTVQGKLRETISVKDFGAVGDGATDDTNAFKSAIQAAAGGYVFVPIGEYRITSPLDAGITEEIRLVGPVSAFFSHGFIDFPIYNYNNDFSPACIADPAGLATKFATIKCDGTNLLGSADGATVGTKETLRHLANLCVYGYNGAEIGLYVSPMDALVENCHFALFEKFGICIRGGITSTFRKISFMDNGWNLNESGSTVHPATYLSGCAFNVVSNFIPNDFYTAVGGNATTTMSFENFYINVRGWTGQNQSGYRGIQIHLARGVNMDDIGSYTGHYFYIAQASGNNIYVENYAHHGLTAASTDPHCIYSKYSALTLGVPMLTNNAVPTLEPLYVEGESQVWSPTAVWQNDSKTTITREGSVTSRFENEIVVGTPGSTVSYVISNHTMPDTKGFCGFLILGIYKKTDIADYAYLCVFAQKHTAGLGGDKISPATSIASYNTGSGAFTKSISNLTFTNSGAITFDVTWGAGYSASEEYYVNFALVGMDTLTAP